MKRYRITVLPMSVLAPLLALAVFLAAAAVPLRAEASRAVHVRPGDDIAALVEELPDNMMIVMAPGTYRLSLILTGRNLIFLAPEGAVVEPGEQGFAFWVEAGSAIALDGLSIQAAPGEQPPVVVQNAVLRLKNVAITSPDQIALYAEGADSEVEMEGGRLESGGGAALFASDGATVILREVEALNTGAGIAVAVQQVPRLEIRETRLAGNVPLQAIAVREGVSVADSFLRGRGAQAVALVLEQVARLEIIDSVLLSDGSALQGGIDTDQTWRITGALLAGRQGGAFGVTGAEGADLEIENSAVIALQEAGEAYSALVEGAGFQPRIADSLLLARGGSALVVQGGAGALVARDLLAGGDGPLGLFEHDPERLVIGESLLVPDVSNEPDLRAAMDEASLGLSLRDPDLARAAAEQFLADLTAAVERAPGDAPGDHSDLLRALEATFIDFAILHEELAAIGQGQAQVTLQVVDMAGQTATGLPFSLSPADGGGALVSEDGAPLLAVPAGEYIAESPGARPQRLHLEPGERMISLEAPDALLAPLAAELFADGDARQALLPLRAAKARPEALATMLPPGVFRRPVAPRADAPAEQVAKALAAARSYLAAFRAAGSTLPEEQPRRRRTDFTVYLAKSLIALYGDAAADAKLLAGLGIRGPERSYASRLVLTARMEARAGVLERGVLAGTLERGQAESRLVPALLLHLYGVERATRVLLRDLSDPERGLDTWHRAFALQAMLDVDAPELVPVALEVLRAAGRGEDLPAGAAGAALAWMLAHGEPARTAELARGLPALRERDLLFLAPLISDTGPLLYLLAGAAKDPFLPARLLDARRGLPDAAREFDATLNAVAAIAPPKALGQTTSPFVISSEVELSRSLPSIDMAGLTIGGRGNGTNYARLKSTDLPGHAFNPELVAELPELLAGQSPWSALNLLGYLPLAEAQALIERTDLSAYPAPEVIRTALPLVVDSFRSQPLSRRLSMVRPMDGSFLIPFALADPVPEGEETLSGATSGVLRLRPRRIGEVLQFDVRLDYRSFYPDRCSFGMCTERDRYRFHRFVTTDAARLIDEFRLLLPTEGGGFETIPARRVPNGPGSRYVATLPPEVAADRLAVAFTLQYGGLRIPVVRPLWSTAFASRERRLARLREEARSLRADPAPGTEDLAEAIRRLEAAGLPGEAAPLWTVWGRRSNAPVEGFLRAAETLLSAGAPGLAAETLRAGLSVRPGNGDLLYALGIALESAEDHTGAQAAFEELLAANPRDAEALALAARNALFAGSVADADTLFERLSGSARGPVQRALAALAARANGRDTVSEADFMADLAAIAARRPGARAPTREDLQAALSPAAEAPPTHCDLAAFAGRWLTEEAARMRLDQARALCPKGDVAAHLAHGPIQAVTP